jgi:protoporphyrin/coproporphyrin ferrochelatase
MDTQGQKAPQRAQLAEGERSQEGRGRTGVLLVNLGTPASPRTADVRRYLRQFLSDPRVIDIPPALRFALLHFVILPFRPRRSAAQYATIWQEGGSPLLIHGRALSEEVAKRLGPRFHVELGMRYGEPSLPDALARLRTAEVDRIVVFPLFPQYASSSTGSALEVVYREAAAQWNVPSLRVLEPFYADPGFIGAQAGIARPLLERFAADHVLFSFHGLPERQIRKSDPSGAHCFARPDCCARVGPHNASCYRAQSHATAHALAGALALGPGLWSVSFQSRLGRAPWIKPYTDLVLPELAARGVRRLAIFCPSFVADCLETVEEIGVRAREQWSSLGGSDLLLVPCVNAHPDWADAVVAHLRAAAD